MNVICFTWLSLIYLIISECVPLPSLKILFRIIQSFPPLIRFYLWEKHGSHSSGFLCGILTVIFDFLTGWNCWVTNIPEPCIVSIMLLTNPTKHPYNHPAINQTTTKLTWTGTCVWECWWLGWCWPGFELLPHGYPQLSPFSSPCAQVSVDGVALTDVWGACLACCRQHEVVRHLFINTSFIPCRKFRSSGVWVFT